MADLRFSADARADLEEIRNVGIDKFGEQAAERHLQGFRRIFQLLAEHPFAGQERSEFRQNIRAISHRPHRILYMTQGEVVAIVRVIHEARDVGAALRGHS